MIKILSSADWHVNLHRKKIPVAWQMKRFQLLFDKLLHLEESCDVHVIAGDLFDKEPDPDEICLVLSYLNSVQKPTIVVPGNHEATTRGRTFWEHFKLENTIKNSLVHILTENERICLAGQWFSAFPYSSVQTDKLPQHIPGDILVTHIRGEVPPHITAEYDFEKLRPCFISLIDFCKCIRTSERSFCICLRSFLLFSCSNSFGDSTAYPFFLAIASRCALEMICVPVAQSKYELKKYDIGRRARFSISSFLSSSQSHHFSGSVRSSYKSGYCRISSSP
jgi:hypothetical protein